MIINLKEHAEQLCMHRTGKINVMQIHAVMQELDVKYKRGCNDVYWYQLFLNGSWLERIFKTLNPELDYVEDNHDVLGEQTRGNNYPDFKFKRNSKDITLDTKTFFSLTKFNNATAANFEDSKYIIAFIMSERKFYYRRQLDDHKDAYTAATPMTNLPPVIEQEIGWIKLPDEVIMFNLGAKAEQTDAELAPELTYFVNRYSVVK